MEEREYIASLIPGLYNELPDKTGWYLSPMGEKTIMPKSQYDIIWYVSWLSFGSGIYAIYCGHSDLAWVPFGVWATSINYWRLPDYSWRRKLDYGVVGCGLLSSNCKEHSSIR